MRVKAVISLFLSFYFALASLFPRTDFNQLCDLVHVWKHFQYHNTSGTFSNSGLIDFLADHYLQGDTHQHQDTNRHSDLPLKSFQSEIIQLVPTESSTNAFDCILKIEIPGNFFILSPTSSGFIDRIFQPPIGLDS